MTCRSDRNDVIVIGGGNMAITASIAHMLSAIDNIVVVEPQEPILINVNDFGCIGEIVAIKNEHGKYRQFEKRDKRKNFRGRK